MGVKTPLSPITYMHAYVDTCILVRYVQERENVSTHACAISEEVGSVLKVSLSNRAFFTAGTEAERLPRPGHDKSRKTSTLTNHFGCI